MRVARFIPLAFTAWFIVGQAQAQVNYQILHGFENPPRAPLKLVRGSDGALYGLTAQGGNGADSSTEGWGTVFKIQEDGSGFRKLHDFNQANGSLANTLIKGSGALWHDVQWRPRGRGRRIPDRLRLAQTRPSGTLRKAMAHGLVHSEGV